MTLNGLQYWNDRIGKKLSGITVKSDKYYQSLFRPEELQEIIEMKRFRIKHFFIFSLLCLIISFFLFFIFQVGGYVFFITFLAGFVGTGMYGPLTYMQLSNKRTRCYLAVHKIAITTTGIFLVDSSGKILYMMPFAKVKSISIGYMETVLSLVFKIKTNIPDSIIFELEDGKWFTYPLHDVVEGDKRKIYPYLRAFPDKPLPGYRG